MGKASRAAREQAKLEQLTRQINETRAEIAAAYQAGIGAHGGPAWTWWILGGVLVAGLLLRRYL